jgi:hypothetical protein
MYVASGTILHTIIAYCLTLLPSVLSSTGVSASESNLASYFYLSGFLHTYRQQHFMHFIKCVEFLHQLIYSHLIHELNNFF